MTSGYQLSSIIRPQQDEILAIQYDSKANMPVFSSLLEWLQADGIRQIDVVLLQGNNHFKYAGTASCQANDDYFYNRLWRCDLNCHFHCKVVDLTRYRVNRGYACHDADMLYLYMDGYYLGSKDSFIFGVSKPCFSRMSALDRLRLYERLQSAISYLYKSLVFHYAIAVPQYELTLDLAGTGEFYTNYDQVCQAYKLTHTNMLVLKYIANGCPAVKVADYLHKSPRTIEDQVAQLNGKLGVESKGKLESAASIVLSQLQCRKVVFELL